MKNHSKRCECDPCVVARVSEYLDRIHDKSRLIPEYSNQTVAVRAHWRRHPGHLKKMPKTRALLRMKLDEQMKKER